MVDGQCYQTFAVLAACWQGVAGGGRVSGLERGTGQLLRAMPLNQTHSPWAARAVLVSISRVSKREKERERERGS